MKRLTILFAALVFLFVGVQAQEQTTLEEYRYMSKGFVYQLEMGLDANKVGYTVKDLYTASNGTELIGLYADGIASPKALLFVIKPEKAKPIYLCVPTPSSNERVVSLYEIDQQQLKTQTEKATFQLAMQEFLYQSLNSNEVPMPRTTTPPVAQNTQKAIPSSYQNDELTSKGSDLSTAVIPSTSSKTQSITIKNAPKKASSTVVTQGDLNNRTIIEQASPDGYSQKKGRVAIKICVDRSGNVITAKFTQRGSTTFDRYLKKIALDAAKKTKFAKNDIREQCGILNYTFN